MSVLQKYIITKDLHFKYDVGRDGIGMVEQLYRPGNTVIGQEQPNGTLRVNAVYTVGTIHYHTPIFIEKGAYKHFFVRNYDKIQEPFNKNVLTEYVIIGLGIWFGLMISND